jgi:pyruvate kinase
MTQRIDRSEVQIIATIGPSSAAREKMSQMIVSGMDVASLNCAWGDHAQYEMFIEPLREEARKLGRTIPWIFDLPGLRTHGEHSGPVGSSVSVTKRTSRT